MSELLLGCGHQRRKLLVPSGRPPMWDQLTTLDINPNCVPSRYGPWLWGDPGHTRAILRESLAFLDRRTYAQLGTTTMSDYRPCWPGDFECVYHRELSSTFEFVLKAIKPARPYPEVTHAR